MWSTGYTKILHNLEEAKTIIKQVESLGLNIGKPVRYNQKIFKIKQLWISGVKDIDVRVELDAPHMEDYLLELDDIEYGPAIEALFGEKNVTT